METNLPQLSPRRLQWPKDTPVREWGNRDRVPVALAPPSHRKHPTCCPQTQTELQGQRHRTDGFWSSPTAQPAVCPVMLRAAERSCLGLGDLSNPPSGARRALTVTSLSLWASGHTRLSKPQFPHLSYEGIHTTSLTMRFPLKQHFLIKCLAQCPALSKYSLNRIIRGRLVNHL